MFECDTVRILSTNTENMIHCKCPFSVFRYSAIYFLLYTVHKNESNFFGGSCHKDVENFRKKQRY